MIPVFKKRQCGQATWDLLVSSLLLFVILFGVVDYWVAMFKIQQAEHLKNYYLDRSRIEGMLTADDRANLVKAFDKIGFNVSSIDSPSGRVVRTLNISATSYPEVWLEIEAEFKDTPFMIGVFLGSNDNKTLSFKGREISEYIGP